MNYNDTALKKKNTKLGKNQRQRQQNELIISTLKETKQKKN